MRYRFIVDEANLDKLKDHKDGLLVLANHTTHLDGHFLVCIFFKNGMRKIVLWIIDFCYRLPYLGWLCKNCRSLRFISVPNLSEERHHAPSSVIEGIVDETVNVLDQGYVCILFPAGHSKMEPQEEIAGKSAVERILQKRPETHIVVATITGAWGSTWSWAIKRADRFNRVHGIDQQFKAIIKDFLYVLLKNGLFFAPRRPIRIDFTEVTNTFPRFGSRKEMNTFLQERFQQAWGKQGEPLHRVSTAFWKNSYREYEYKKRKVLCDHEAVPFFVVNDVLYLLANKAKIPLHKIEMGMCLSRDLGLDSLEITEVFCELEQKYGLDTIKVDEILSVGHLSAVCSKIPVAVHQEIGEFHDVVDIPCPFESAKRSAVLFTTNCVAGIKRTLDLFRN